MKRNNSDQYDKLSKAFHWITAIIIVIAFILAPEDFGQLLHKGIDPSTRSDIVWHESLGILIFVLTFLRLLWVAIRPAAPKHTMATWMRRLSKLMHIVFWILLFALPLSALQMLGTETDPLTLLGGFRIDEPPFITNAYFSDLADWGEVHTFLGNAIMWLAGIHALVAIYHHIKLKDKVLSSMLP